MTSTQFDGSTGGGPGLPPVHEQANGHAELDYSPEMDAQIGGEMSAIEQLRAVVDRQEQKHSTEVWTRVVADGDIRLSCRMNVDSKEYRRWQKGAMPKAKSKIMARQPDPTDIDQFLLSAFALRSTMVSVEVRDRKIRDTKADNAWIVITDPHSRHPLTTDDTELLSMFRTPDPNALLVKLIGRESDVIGVGLELIEALGFLGTDEPDPT